MIPILLANAIAADAGLIPGLAIFGPAMGLPVSLLAAFIERPFVTRAGFGRSAMWFSLQANFVSLLVGYVGTLIVIPLVIEPNPAIGLVWPFLAVGISIVTERQYLQSRLIHARVPWAPVAVANVVSSLVCIAVLVAASTLRESNRSLAAELRPYEMPGNLVVAACSLVLFVGSFAARAPSAGAQTPAEPPDAMDSR
jgi:hypothetical protein